MKERNGEKQRKFKKGHETTGKDTEKKMKERSDEKQRKFKKGHETTGKKMKQCEKEGKKECWKIEKG